MDPKAIHERLTGAFGDKIAAFTGEALQPSAVVAAEAIADVGAFCKNEPDLAFAQLSAIAVAV